MTYCFCEPKSADSRESSLVSLVTIFSSLYSVIKRTASAFMLITVSIVNSFFGDLESKNVLRTKPMYDKLSSFNGGELTELEPQFGTETQFSFDQLKSLAALRGVDLPESLFSKIEGLGLLVACLSECDSATQALSIFLLYLKTHYSESIVKKGAEAFSLLIDSTDELECQSGLGKPQWLSMLREHSTNWKLLTNNPVFKKVSYLISICISLGLCDAANFEWNIGGVKAFSIPAMDKHFSAFDLIDAGIETVMYFVEGGYECFQTGSMTPFLFSDHRAREFELNYSTLVQNLEHVKTGNLRSLTKMNENDYDLLLSKTLTEADELYRAAKGTWEKKILYDRLVQLKKIRATFDSTRVKGGLREAPYTVNFFGKSGVGKSSVSAISMVVGLMSNGYCAEDEMMATLNESDKFMSNYRSFVNGIFIDDIGNTKPDFVEKSPTNKIIEICNNVKQYANMAEADMKGKVSIEPKFVNLTTNVKALGAHVYSNEPVSIARRAHLTVTVTVKPEFCTSGMAGSIGQQLDSDKVRQFYTDEEGVENIPFIPDLWNLTVERVIPAPTTVGPDNIAYEVMTHNGKTLKDVSILVYLDFMIDMSRQHFQNQRSFVTRSNNLASKITMCECGKPTEVCGCLHEQGGYIFGSMLGVVLNDRWQKIRRNAVSVWTKEGSVLERMATSRLLDFAGWFEHSPYFAWTNYVPHSWLKHRYGKTMIEHAMRDEIILTIRRDVISLSVLAVLSLITGVYLGGILGFTCLIFAIHLLIRCTVVTQTVKERVYSEICERNDAMPDVFKKIRDTKAKRILMVLGAVGVLYTLLKVFQGFRNASKETQGNLAPTTEKEIQDRDAESNPWSKVQIEPVPFTSEQATATIDQVSNRVFINQVFMRVKQGSDFRISGAVFMRSNVLLMPYHMWFEDGNSTGIMESDLDAQFVRYDAEKVGSKFRAYLSDTSMVKIPDTDLCIVWVPNAGDSKDITRWLPVDSIRSGLARMSYRDGKGLRVDASARLDAGLVGHRRAQFEGASYELSIPTFNGLCMATFIAEGKVPYIAGFHLGGKTGHTCGVLGTINQGQLGIAIKKLMRCEGALLGVSSGTLPETLYGKTILSSQEVHPKSPVNFLEGDTNMKVFGSAGTRVTPHSSVVTTCISKTVTKVTGVPQLWGPPRFNPHWKSWQDSLAFSSNPSPGVEGTLLRKAVIDYKIPLVHTVRSNAYVRDQIRPLTRMETICGRDGQRFIDKMSPKTSVGFPLTGPKSEYMLLLDPKDFPEFNCPAELDSMFWEEFERIEAVYLKGERAYPIFKACLKDEPTKLTKSKVRVFQSAPVVLQLLVRMYFLPIARFLSLHPLMTECAVGVNCQGPEWNQLQEHVTKFGQDRILAGDYSKYDLRMPAQTMLAAFRIMIDIARESGNYSERDFLIMEGVATDIVYPMMAYNGTLIQLIGSNPSGQNLTVYINSIVNSLLFRCAYFAITPGTEKFRDVCALITYGDDAKSSVKKGYDEFNHLSVAKFLEEHDMKFTMPDKESTPVPYMRDEDCDFLKRKSVYHPEAGLSFGALDEQSIFKSLHSTLSSKFLSDREQAVENIDGALREWFAHGRDVYEKRRSQMQEIARECDLLCRETGVSYDSRMAAWKDKYVDNL